MDKFKRFSLVHACVVVLAILLAAALNYLLWSYKPDTRFDTLENALLPVVRPVFTIALFGVVCCIAFDRLTLRVLRMLARKQDI